MVREKSPNRLLAYEVWKENILIGRDFKLKSIAEQLNEPDSRVRKWKCEDNWEGKLLNENPNNIKYPSKARFGNKNAKGNKGGAPTGNKNNVKHGFFTRILPEDALELAKDIEIKKPINILWENIVIQYVAIARAQKIMYVKDEKDITREIKNCRNEDMEYEIQFSWDKHANFMQAQSRAMATLQGMIIKYEELLNQDTVNENQKLRVEKLKLDIESMKHNDEEFEDDGFVEALEGKLSEAWENEE